MLGLSLWLITLTSHLRNLCTKNNSSNFCYILITHRRDATRGQNLQVAKISNYSFKNC